MLRERDVYEYLIDIDHEIMHLRRWIYVHAMV